MSCTTISIALLGILLGIVYYLYNLWRTYSYWKDKGVAGPSPIPIFGNYKSVILHRQTEAELLHKIYEDYPDEKFVGMYKGVQPVLLVKDPDIIKYVMAKSSDTFQDRCIEEANTYFDNSLFLMKGDTRWQMMRQAMTPAFTKSKLTKMIPALHQCSNNYMTYIDKQVKYEKDVELCDLNMKYVLEVVGSLVLGLDLDTYAEEKKFEKFLTSLFHLQIYASMVNTLPFIFPLLYTFITPIVKLGFIKTIKTIHTFLSPIIYRKERHETIKYNFIEYLIDLKEKCNTSDDKVPPIDIDDDVIIQQSMTYCMASYKSMAHTMSYIIYELALNQDIQNKCYEEITEVLRKHNGVLSLESISDMKYLDMVFSESMRKHSLTQAIDRKCGTKYTLPGTDLTIDKGVFVVLSTFGLQYDPKYYPNPNVFDPERFSTENKAKIPQCTFLNFGYGPRNCVGARFAKNSILMGFIKILQKFRAVPSDKTYMKLTYDTKKIKAVVPANGLWVTLQRRDEINEDFI